MASKALHTKLQIARHKGAIANKKWVLAFRVLDDLYERAIAGDKVAEEYLQPFIEEALTSSLQDTCSDCGGNCTTIMNELERRVQS